MNAVEKTAAMRESGYNCAQSVLMALSEYTALSDELASAISAGFGGGLRSGEVCGAICGAVMAFGIVCPFTDPENEKTKADIAKLASEFTAQLREKYTCVRCDELKAAEISCGEIVSYCTELSEKIIINYMETKENGNL